MLANVTNQAGSIVGGPSLPEPVEVLTTVALERLKGDYWLYAVFHGASTPSLFVVQNPVQLWRQSLMSVEHYPLSYGAVLSAPTPDTGER